MNKKRIGALLLATTLGLGLLAGCAPKNAPDSGSRDTIVFPSMVKSEAFNPVDGSTTDKVAMHQIYDTLVNLDNDGNPSPCLAERWEEAADGITVTFHLRKGVKFHNGADFTADDVIYTLDTFFEAPNNAYAHVYLGDYKKVDDYTIEVTKASVYGKIYNFFAENPYILCKSAYEADPEGYGKNPIGTGAYKFVSKGADDSVTLVANEDYFLGAPAIKNAIIKAPLDASTAVVALETGEADIIHNLDATQLALVQNNDKLKVNITAGYSMNTLMMLGGQFKGDVNLRQAVWHAVNRDNAITLANEGVGTPATNFYADRIMGDMAGIVTFDGYDLEVAKDYLSKSNYDPSKPITMSISADMANLAQSIQADLKAIGVDMKIEQLDTNAFYDKLLGGNVEITLLAFGTDMQACEDMLAFLTATNTVYGPCVENSPVFDQLVADMASVADTTARAEMVKQALEIQIELANFVPIFEPTFNTVYAADLDGMNPTSAATYIYYLKDLK